MSKTFVMLIAILMFAFITAFLYGWGIIKAANKEKDLYRILYNKGAVRIMDYLKKEDFITVMEFEKQISGLKAGLFYSRQRAVITDKKEFARNLQAKMIEKKLISEQTVNGKKGFVKIEKGA